MEKGETPIVQPREVRATERISDEEMGNLLAAFGNNEAKALTFVLMQQGTIYPKGNLYRIFTDAQGGLKKAGWRMNKGTPFSYCENSLAPIGLVAKEVVEGGIAVRTYGYMTTEYGENIGKPLAGLLLDFSVRHPDFSLADFFGSTSSSSDKMGFRKRAPLTRLRILRELAVAKLPIREADLLGRIEDSYLSLVENHLLELKRKGIIDYESVRKDKPVATYTFSSPPGSDNPLRYEHDPLLARGLYDILKESPEKDWTAEQLADEYIKRSQKQLTDEQKESIRKKRIYSSLSHLASQGFVKVSGKFTEHTQSEIGLSQLQKEAVCNLVAIIDSFQNRDPEIFKDGQNFSNRIASNHGVMASLMQKAKEHSAFANRRPPDEHAAIIYSIISQVPGISTREITERVKKVTGVGISKTRINELLLSLLQSGQIETENKKDVRRFTVKPLL